MQAILDKNMTLRSEIKAGDREAIRNLLSAAGCFQPYEIDVALELFDDRMNKGARSDYWFQVAEIEGRLAGYICYGPITVTRGSFDLYWIGVQRQFQGRGVGGFLLEAAEAHIRQMGGRYLYIETSSLDLYASTRLFYQHHRYREVARVPFFYADDDDQIIFMKALG